MNACNYPFIAGYTPLYCDKVSVIPLYTVHKRSEIDIPLYNRLYPFIL